MRIVVLVDRASARIVLVDAGELAARGHDVTVLAEVSPPADLELACLHVTRDALHADHVPQADLLVATSPATMALAADASRGAVAVYDQTHGAAHDRIAALSDRRTRRPGAGHQLPAGIDESLFHPVERRPRADRALDVGGRGRAESELAEVCAALADRGVRARAVAIEDAADTAARAAALRRLDVFVATDASTTATEVLEAMACGVPCVLADVPALRTAVGDRRGAALLVEPDDPCGLTESVGLLARHAGLRAQLRRAGLEIAAAQMRAARTDALERAFALIAGRGSAQRPALDHDGTDLDLVQALARRAESHLRAERLADAATCLEAALAIVPDSPLLWTWLGEARLRSGDARAAVTALERACATGGTSCRLHEMRATAFHALAQIDAAARALGDAIGCEDARPATFRALADALRATGDLQGARAATEEATVRAALG